MAQPDGMTVVRYDLAQAAVVTQVISNTQFVAETLAGFDDGTFVGYSVWVLSKADGSINAPKGDAPSAITAFSGYRAVPPAIRGTVTHAAFTAGLVVGDTVLILNPAIASAFSGGSGISPTRNTVTGNWQAAETNLVSLGIAGGVRTINMLAIGIQNLVGNISIRMYMQVNGVERQIYPIPLAWTYNVAVDPPAIPVINGTMGIFGLLRVTIQSDNAADNGAAVTYEAN
jgi:hypothetical protein